MNNNTQEKQQQLASAGKRWDVFYLAVNNTAKQQHLELQKKSRLSDKDNLLFNFLNDGRKGQETVSALFCRSGFSVAAELNSHLFVMLGPKCQARV